MAAQQLNANDAHPVIFSMSQRTLAILQSIRPKSSTANKTSCFQSYAHFKPTRTLSQQHDTLADDINTARKLEPSTWNPIYVSNNQACPMIWYLATTECVLISVLTASLSTKVNTDCTFL